jgi:hypothetical protein
VRKHRSLRYGRGWRPGMLDEELPEYAGRLLGRLGNIKEDTASRFSSSRRITLICPRSSPPGARPYGY